MITVGPERGAVAELPVGVDEDILAGRAIHTIASIREARGCTLPEAIALFHQRAAELSPLGKVSAAQGPFVLRIEPDGSLVVHERPPEDHPGSQHKG
ncbi:hypothetical protein [Actinacidiphila acidipaludis]|uniref:Uncharacterized protein n=1 Tax=Actinacidiphila acidipaludis TaxID=2873382 RepID=A0ABS7QIA5_9ACTN|nr:hypothetical protein [Streptomyces acidipaludis]MBY8882911.1 hypothetical protein [Streptomyces acidipaludis]